jgi:hypothetical protein
MTGAVVVPGQDGYEPARSIWNGDVERHPSVVTRCGSAAEALRCARDTGLEVGVRGGRRLSPLFEFVTPVLGQIKATYDLTTSSTSTPTSNPPNTDHRDPRPPRSVGDL